MRPGPRSVFSLPLACLAGLVLAAGLPPSATASTGSVHPGVKAGVSLSNFSGELHDLGGLDVRTQPTFGGFVRFDVAPSLAVVPELQYVRKGATAKATATDADGNEIGTITAAYQLHYVEIPVQLQYRFATAGKVAPNVYVAPTLAFAVTRKFVADAGGLILGSNGEIDLKDEVRSTEFLAAMGAGLDWKAGAGVVVFDVRYELGVQKVFTATSAADDRNWTALATLGYAF